MTLQDRHNIHARTLSVNIKCRGLFFFLFLKLEQINFIFADNVRILTAQIEPVQDKTPDMNGRTDPFETPSQVYMCVSKHWK